MSLAAESLSSGSSDSSSDEFAAFLENQIEAEIQEDDDELAPRSNKRRRFTEEISTCSHPIIIRNLCSHCGHFIEDTGQMVAFNYIHKDLRLGASEIDKLRIADLKQLLKQRKLILVLDLDHTLINSTMEDDVSPDEQYLKQQVKEFKDDPNSTLFWLGRCRMLTKLRPFVHTFLKEAKNMFEMYIYTMAQHAYALDIANLLDSEGEYFHSRVICQSDCTLRNQKGLDVILGADNIVIILDDSEQVWQKHKENLILMERYNYFASSVRHFHTGTKSLSEMKKDERESDGILATILNVLKRVHEMFFDPGIGIDLPSRDVRQIMKLIKQEILEGCNIVFSKVLTSNVRAEEDSIWKLAEQMGAMCYTDVNDSVTHVVAADPNTKKAEWARVNKKFLVTRRWIDAANYLWQRQKEEDFALLRLGSNGQESTAFQSIRVHPFDISNYC